MFIYFKGFTKAMLTPLTGLYEMIQKRPLQFPQKKYGDGADCYPVIGRITDNGM